MSQRDRRVAARTAAAPAQGQRAAARAAGRGPRSRLPAGAGRTGRAAAKVIPLAIFDPPKRTSAGERRGRRSSERKAARGS